jgi:arginine/lysine/ornithine decarboxylase
VSEAPYLDALLAYARRNPGRFHVPGHKGGLGADPGLVAAIGRDALAFDIPTLIEGIDVGSVPTSFQRAQTLAAEAWGARRTWFLVNGASQANHVAMLALAHFGGEVVVQRNAHSSTIDGLVMSGLRPTFVAPDLDPDLQVAHCVTPEALDAALAATPGAVGATIVSPTYFGAVADVRGLAEVAHARGVVLIADEAWGAHFAFHERLPQTALDAGADLVVSSTHKIIGSLTQSAMLHLGGDRLDEAIVDRCVTVTESTSPSSLLSASLDAARRHAQDDGRALLEETIDGTARLREEVRAIDGLDVLDERMCGSAGVVDFDPLRLSVDVRGTGASGYEIADWMREDDDINTELAGENVVVAVFGMGEPVAETGAKLVAGLRRAAERAAARPPREHEAFAPPPPWGPLALPPRDAFLGPQEVVAVEDAAGRIATESLAAYPPGIPNVLPGERLSVETLEYIRQTLDQGGYLRGASDRKLRTLRVVVERN